MQSFYRKKVDEAQLDKALAKWPYAVLDEGYVPLPKRLLRCLPRLFRGAKAMEDLAITLAIVDYKKPFSSPPPSIEFLSFLAGMEPKRFRAGLKRLVDAGYAEVALVGEDRISVDLSGLHAKIVEQTAETDLKSD